MAIPRDLDHLVYGVPDLADGVSAFSALTGVEPMPGGRHLGLGTANYLVGLTDGSSTVGYLELIGPDPASPAPDRPRPFGVDDLSSPRLLTWCLRPADLTATIDAAKQAGYDPGEPAQMSRVTTTGGLLQWRLTPDTVGEDGVFGIVPFLIDWEASSHPTENPSLPMVELHSLVAVGANLAVAEQHLAALDIDLAFEQGPVVGLRAVLWTSHGEITLD
ncbi:VOC family protein [Jatrophihabitans sp. DSM 45814]